MVVFEGDAQILSFSSALLLLILNSNQALHDCVTSANKDDGDFSGDILYAPD
jgi:hypothetical protein